MARFCMVLSLVLLSCARSAPGPLLAEPVEHESAAAPVAAEGVEVDEPVGEGDELLVWKGETRSPWPSTRAGAPCGERDGALDAAAAQLAERALAGLPPLEPTEIHTVLRAHGAPYVWARAWSLDGTKLDDADVSERVKRWLAKSTPVGEHRCGFARVARDGREVAFAVAADVLADLEPLALRARSGQWIRVRGKLRVPASEAKVVVLGPRGAPKPVPTSLSGGVIGATFSADRPGTWMVQLVATVDGGPRPVAEALLHVDREPPKTFHARSAPGEQAAGDTSDAAAALLRMVNAARSTERLGALSRDARLDRIAEEHAKAMQAAGRIGHDVGGGTAADRMRASGLSFRGAGENVARAASIERAHRALWASPSHRGNLLDPRFSAIGVGVVKDPDGTVWACEVFAAWR